jgi:hypothetical protein
MQSVSTLVFERVSLNTVTHTGYRICLGQGVGRAANNTAQVTLSGYQHERTGLRWENGCGGYGRRPPGNRRQQAARR